MTRQWLVRRRTKSLSRPGWSDRPWVVYMPLDSRSAIEHSRWASWEEAYAVAFNGAGFLAADIGGS